MEVENWNLDFLVKCVTEAITFVKQEGLPSMFVTEDTVRAAPRDRARRSTAPRSIWAPTASSSATRPATSPRGA